MLDLSRIKWVFFDVGYTLVSEEDGARERIDQIVEILKHRGIARSADEVRSAFEQAVRDYSTMPIRTVASLLAPNEPDVEFLAKETTWRKELDRPFPAATETLRRIRQRFHVGVIANQSAGTMARLTSYGWGDLIELCISSTEEKLTKPDPAIFRLALDRAGCRADEAVMVGDRLDNDITPAKSVGMATIRVLQGFAAVQSPRDDREAPDLTVNSIADVPRALGL
jgi:HAD superfamily hydrolase (TIGR01549 family)